MRLNERQNNKNITKHTGYVIWLKIMIRGGINGYLYLCECVLIDSVCVDIRMTPHTPKSIPLGERRREEIMQSSEVENKKSNNNKTVRAVF